MRTLVFRFLVPLVTFFAAVLALAAADDRKGNKRGRRRVHEKKKHTLWNRKSKIKTWYLICTFVCLESGKRKLQSLQKIYIFLTSCSPFTNAWTDGCWPILMLSFNPSVNLNHQGIVVSTSKAFRYTLCSTVNINGAEVFFLLWRHVFSRLMSFFLHAQIGAQQVLWGGGGLFQKLAWPWQEIWHRAIY